MQDSFLRLLMTALLVSLLGQAGLFLPVSQQSIVQTAYPTTSPLSAADFAVTLPGGTFNFVTDDRAVLERITGQAFERYGESPLTIYDRLLTEHLNFFANPGDPYVESISFEQGGELARGIHKGSTEAELLAAYGEPDMYFTEHGTATRIEYSYTTVGAREAQAPEEREGAATYELRFVTYPSDGKVHSIQIYRYCWPWPSE